MNAETYNKLRAEGNSKHTIAKEYDLTPKTVETLEIGYTCEVQGINLTALVELLDGGITIQERSPYSTSGSQEE